MPQIASAAPDLKKRIQGQVAASTTMVDGTPTAACTLRGSIRMSSTSSPRKSAMPSFDSPMTKSAMPLSRTSGSAVTRQVRPQTPSGRNTTPASHTRTSILQPTPNLAGKTDRGRIYIVYGKPYAVDSHPSGGINADGTTSSPFEEWHYRLGGGKPDTYFRFTDAGSPGDYKLSVGPSPSAARSTPNVAEDSAGQQPPMIAVAAKPVGPMRVAAGVVAGNALHQVPPGVPT